MKIRQSNAGFNTKCSHGIINRNIFRSMETQNYEIFEGNEVMEELTDEDLDVLVDLWTREKFDPSGTYLKLPRKIKIFLSKEKAGRNLFRISSEIYGKIHRILSTKKYRKFYSERENEFKNEFKKELQELIGKEDLIIAKKGQKVVGMVRVAKQGHIKPNKFTNLPVYELGRALVVPEERNKGVYKQLRAKAINHLRKKYGDVPILTGTKNESVKKMNRADGWKEIGFDEYLRLHGTPEEYIKQAGKGLEKEGWTAFLFIPNTKIEWVTE